MRLHALIGDRRIPELALRRHDRAVDIAITNLSVPLQRFGHRLQERISVPDRQRASRGDDGIELDVGKSKRRHAAGFRGGYSTTPFSIGNCASQIFDDPAVVFNGFADNLPNFT
jgi:hypothetical protein